MSLHAFFSAALRRSFPLITFLFFTAITNCGSISHQALDSATPSTSAEATTTSRIYAFTTDYQSSGQIYTATVSDATTTELTNTGLSYLGSSAIIRVYDGLLYILHDGFSTVSTDNLQIIDPSDHYATLGQYSTGNGTNPHDVLVSGTRAFITLYNPTADADNTDANGNPGDVIEMDTTTGTITRRFSFQNYLNTDGDLNTNADQMVLVGNILYVTLQDLDSNTFAASSSGLIGMIDISTNTVQGVIPLQGRDPVGLALSADHSTLAVADMATYNSTLGNFDTATPYGGIEIVDLTLEQSTTLIADENLGGFVERIEADATKFYIVVSDFNAADFSYTSRLLTTPQTLTSSSDFTVLDDSGTDIREIAIDNDVLWISRRQINTQTGLSDPLLEAIDLDSGEQLGNELQPVAPGMSVVPGS